MWSPPSRHRGEHRTCRTGLTRRKWSRRRLRLVAVLRLFLGRLFGGDAVAFLEPAAEVDVAAARRAEGLIARRDRLAAGRAASPPSGKLGHRIIGVGFRHAPDILSQLHDVKRTDIAAAEHDGDP